jgi:hypothetical protein
MRSTAWRTTGLILFFLTLSILSVAQAITGVWKGKIGSTRLELKLIRKGDSIAGTSYYYTSKTSYRRYTVKGYFDNSNLDVVWWDDQLVEDKFSKRMIGPEAPPARMAVTDFNCPGEGILKLDGKTTLRDRMDGSPGALHLLKTDEHLFEDEWDYVIENYALGASEPALIDSIARIATAPVSRTPLSSSVAEPVAASSSQEEQAMAVPVANGPGEIPTRGTTNLEKYSGRAKELQTVIPLKGDSIELNFYDNAEIDGDSIAIFLNGKMLFEHIFLTDQPYRLKLSVASLAADNELVMVAENLGSIPPNTSLMVALVGDQRYEAFLRSTEGSSALVRLVKPISPH